MKPRNFLGMRKGAEELVELRGYLVSITPRTRRGLVEYRLRVVTFGGEPWVIYLREPRVPLRPGIPISVKAFLSRQLEKPRWIADELRIIREAGILKPRPAVIEEVVRGVYPIVSGRQDDRFFSVPVEEDVLSSIPKELPQRLYCLFLETGSEVKLVGAFHEKEYALFDRILRLVSSIDQEGFESDRLFEEYLRSRGLAD